MIIFSYCVVRSSLGPTGEPPPVTINCGEKAERGAVSRAERGTESAPWLPDLTLLRKHSENSNKEHRRMSDDGTQRETLSN